MNILPLEIQAMIVELGDALDLLICRQVCSSWYHLVGLTYQRSGKAIIVTKSTQVASLAVERGYLNLVIWVLSKFSSTKLRRKEHHFKRIIEVASAEGYISILDYLYDRQMPLYNFALVYYEHLEVLMWIYYRLEESGWPFTIDCDSCIPLELLEWIENTHSSQVYFNIDGIGADAISKDNLPVIEWARKRGFVPQFPHCILAAQEGNLNMLRWLLSQIDPKTISNTPEDQLDGLGYAAEKCGNLELVKYVTALPWNTVECRVCNTGARLGRLELIEWCRGRNCGCEYYENILHIAFNHGAPISMLNQLLEWYDIPTWDSDDYQCRLTIAHLEWIHKLNPNWMISISDRLDINLSEECLIWLFEHHQLFRLIMKTEYELIETIQDLNKLAIFLRYFDLEPESDKCRLRLYQTLQNVAKYGNRSRRKLLMAHGYQLDKISQTGEGRSLVVAASEKLKILSVSNYNI
jgi:hypothetical protein